MVSVAIDRLRTELRHGSVGSRRQIAVRRAGPALALAAGIAILWATAAAAVPVWTDLPDPPGFHLRGKAVVAADPDPGGSGADRIYIIGGTGFQSEFPEVLDPVTGMWAPAGPGRPPQTPYNWIVDFAAVTAPDGSVYLLGGQVSGGLTDQVLRYVPGAAIWTIMAPMPVPLQEHAAVVAQDHSGSDCIFVFGGTAVSSGGNPRAQVEKYYLNGPGAGTWETTTPPQPMLMARKHLQAVSACNGKIYLAGGTDDQPWNLTRVDSFDPAIDTTPGTWSATPPDLNNVRADFGLVAGSDGRLYAMNGFGNATCSTETVESWDLDDTGAWIYETSTPHGWYGSAYAGFGNEVYAFYGTNHGGCGNAGLPPRSEAYGPLTTTCGATTFTDIGALLEGVTGSSVAWGDYDNDNDLDILLSGRVGAISIANVYRNTNGTFQDIGAGLIGVFNSSMAWGDYDNDGDLDILLTGIGAGGIVSRVYQNTAGVFADIGATLEGVALSSVGWGDYDNDGDLDILLTGAGVGGTGVAKVYQNNGGTFVDVGAALTGVSEFSSAKWGDYDSDGDLDILLAGRDAGVQPIAKVYKNDGGTFTDIVAGLTGVYDSSLAWGDFNNDGNLDILLSGSSSNGKVAKVYQGDGGGGFTDIGAGLTGVYVSSVAWGDYDNDGNLDILLAGADSGNNRVSIVYQGDGLGSFTDIGAALTGVSRPGVAWGDYDNDGDLDILLTGDTGPVYVAQVYENVTPISNTLPSMPSNLAASWATATSVTLSWDPGTDGQTPALGLGYNIRVGTTPGGNEISAAMAEGSTGYRHLPALGNANQALSWTLEVNSTPLYWSVQSVDTAFAGSTFAPEEMTSPGTSSTQGNDSLPTQFALMAGLPNPFRSSTSLRFDLPSAESVDLVIYDAAGRRVRTLASASLPAGHHVVSWDGDNDAGRQIAPGVYFARIRAGSFQDTRRFVRVP